MVFNDTSTRQGLIQDMEDICGLGAKAISGNATLLQQFTRWANKWAKTGAVIAIREMDGWDFDDPEWGNYPSGTFAGQTDRDFVFAGSLKLLKIKSVGICYDGTNYVKASPIDSTELSNVKADPNIDDLVNTASPLYDAIGNAINIYPKMTTAQVVAGAKVYIEFLREPVEFATTDTIQEPGLASPFHQLISKGASLEYCSLYKPAIAQALRLDIYGDGNIPGLLKDLKNWYANRSAKPRRMTIGDATQEFI